MPADRSLIILDSVTSARAMLARGATAGDPEVLATHYSAVDFLAAHGMACHDFSEFTSASQVRASLTDAAQTLDTVLSGLDETLGARMCAAAGLPPTALFHPAFKYFGQYSLAGTSCFEKILGARLSRGGIGSVQFLHALPTSDDALFSFARSAERVCRQHAVPCSCTRVERTAIGRMTGLVRRAHGLALRVFDAPERVPVRAQQLLGRLRTPGHSRAGAAVLLLNASPERFFERALAGCGTALVRQPRAHAVGGDTGLGRATRLAVEGMRAEASKWLRTRQSAQSDLARAIVTCVIRDAWELFSPLARAHLSAQAQTVVAVAWDLPPVSSAPLNLLTGFFLRSGVPVLGRQHGASYVDQNLGSIHFDSDFNRCTHYFSYGSGLQEFAAAYPGVKASCAFIPAGNPPVMTRRRSKTVDVVFPVTNCCSLFSLARMPEHDISRRQLRILQSMEARVDLRCVVKPPTHSNEDNFAHTEALRALRHVRVARATWREYLASWRPRLVIFEIASTPLFETLPLDVDLFLMLDPVFPFSEPALALLRRRVHIFATDEEIVEAIMSYGRRPLTRLRDDAFYYTYVNRGSIDAVPDLLSRLVRHPAGSAVPTGTGHTE